MNTNIDKNKMKNDLKGHSRSHKMSFLSKNLHFFFDLFFVKNLIISKLDQNYKDTKFSSKKEFSKDI